MEKTKVTVLADAAGNHIVPSKNNPEWFHISVKQTRIVVDDRGFARPCSVIAFINGNLATLQSFGWKAGQEVGGTIILKESLVAFDKKMPERNYKVAGATKIVCHSGNNPIYQKYLYSTDANASDVELPKIHDNGKGKMVSHTNSEAIRIAYVNLLAEQKAAAIDKV